tara:strand:- start:353 stop:601 length:249 start_codon:yes stop_codon:yes gene_type:complete
MGTCRMYLIPNEDSENQYLITSDPILLLQCVENILSGRHVSTRKHHPITAEKTSKNKNVIPLRDFILLISVSIFLKEKKNPR